MSDSGDPAQDRQRELDAEREYYESNQMTPEQIYNKIALEISKDITNHKGGNGKRDPSVTQQNGIAAINALLTEARIDELEHIAANAYTTIGGHEFGELMISDRLAELKGKK